MAAETEEHPKRSARLDAERRRAIFNSTINFAIIATDRDGNVTDWNPGAERIFGWSAQEMTGESARRIFTPEDREAGRPDEEMQLSLKHGRASDDRWHIRKDGSRFWASGEMMPLRDDGARDDGGGVFGFTKIVRDRTEEYNTQAALARSEARYRALFEALDDGFCIIEFFDGPHGPLSDYVHVEANTGYARQTGISDIVGKTLRQIAPGGADAWAELYGSVLRTGEPIRFEREFAEVGRHIEVSAARIEPADLRQVSVLFRDITERKRAEAALLDLNATLEQQVTERTAQLRLYGDIVQSSVSPICAFDTEFRLIAFNRTHSDEFFRIFGHRVRLGEVFPDLFPPDQAPVIRGFMARALTGEAFTVTEEFGDPDLAKPCWEVSYSPLKDADGRILGAFHFARDITDRLRAEAELAATQEALRQSQKMEAVGQLTGGLAHDFNNLLAGITGSLELLGRRIAQGRVNDVERYIAAAQGAAKRASSLTHRLLAFSRRQTLDPKPTRVNRLVADMDELVRRTVGPEIEVEVVAAGGLWPTLVDPNQLENALLNLCINARDAMPGGGKLTIETANRWLDHRAARERELTPGQYVSMCVSDNGTGMPPDVIAKAFDPFFTTKPIGQGTGLGLSMIYGFARQSGGQVRIYSEVGQGTMVCLYLPRFQGDANEAEEAADMSGAPRASVGETVLVVDDEPTVRMLVTEVLEELGYAAIEAADGASGLKVLQSDVRIDLLVTDVGLPGGMNGRQMADAARIARPELKVLFITGYAENAVVGHGHLDPGMHVMTKPFPLEALAERIKSLIHSA